MTSNIFIIYTSKIGYLLVLCVYIDIKMIFSHIIEEKNNIKIEILEEAKFMIEHDFQMMNPGSHVTSCFWWLVQALGIQDLESECCIKLTFKIHFRTSHNLNHYSRYSLAYIL